LPAILWAATNFFLSAGSSLRRIAPDIANFDKVEPLATLRLLAETTLIQAFHGGECQKTMQ
jgi:hypothetical protein